MNRSIRARLMVGTSAAMLLMYGIASVVLYVSIRQSLLNEIDTSLEAQARTLAGLVEQGDDGVKLDMEPLRAKSGRSGDGYVIRMADGTMIAGSAESRAEAGSYPAMPITDANDHGFVQIADGSYVRWFSMWFMPRIEDDEHHGSVREENHDEAADGSYTPRLSLLVYRNTAALHEKLGKLKWLLAGVFALTIVTSAGAMAWVVRRGLQPLIALAGGIREIGGDELDRRIALTGMPLEVQPVVDRLNELLERLESSFARERAFTADVAHELRTPLAGLTTALEVCGLRQRSPAEYEQVIASCLPVAGRMRSMIESLLTLARADSRQLDVAFEDVQVEPLLREAWREFEPRAAQRGLHVEWDVNDELLLRTDTGLLSMVLRNLMDNVVTYTNTTGHVRIEGRRTPAGVTIVISNSGSCVASHDVTNLFRRFWRGDSARNMADQHCGLGLALCRQVMSLLNGTIAIDTGAGERFVVIVSIPSDHTP